MTPIAGMIIKAVGMPNLFSNRLSFSYPVKFVNTLLGDHSVVVCTGSGGVGKTTVAAALGILAARQGKRVLVLTVDPARRLATSLGVDDAHSATIVPGQRYSGALYAEIGRHLSTGNEDC